MFDLLVIGGGAAGFYGAVRAAEKNPKLSVAIVEKTSKLLSKVKVSGGGRCNVTHHCFEPKKLSQHYPRGEKGLRELFKTHQAEDVVKWFENNGLALKTEEDGRIFPVSDDSQSVINLFLRKVNEYGIEIYTSTSISEIVKKDDHFIVKTENDKLYKAKRILVAIGGHPNELAYLFLKKLGHTIDKPIPSLFTFNDSHKDFVPLMGVAVPNAFVKIEGTKFSKAGPVLITHWGLSGPGVIKLSAWAAEYLHNQQYRFVVLVSWVGERKEDDLRHQLISFKEQHGKKRIEGNPLFDLPQRLWTKLCELSLIEENKVWGDASMKNINKLIEHLLRCRFEIKGKTTFKEEFVTCGGIPLNEVELGTMESKIVSGLYFAGEVLNIDGETGGFNFQAAWTTAFMAISHLTSVKNM